MLTQRITRKNRRCSNKFQRNQSSREVLRMPGNRKLPRTVRSNVQMVHLIPSEMINSRYSALSASGIPTVHGLDQPTAPKHYPFPNTPVDNDLVFEALMFCYTITAASLQFLHLYRSVWWLPHSYNNHAMVIYLKHCIKMLITYFLHFRTSIW